MACDAYWWCMMVYDGKWKQLSNTFISHDYWFAVLIVAHDGECDVCLFITSKKCDNHTNKHLFIITKRSSGRLSDFNTNTCGREPYWSKSDFFLSASPRFLFMVSPQKSLCRCTDVGLPEENLTQPTQAGPPRWWIAWQRSSLDCMTETSKSLNLGIRQWIKLWSTRCILGVLGEPHLAPGVTIWGTPKTFTSINCFNRQNRDRGFRGILAGRKQTHLSLESTVLGTQGLGFEGEKWCHEWFLLAHWGKPEKIVGERDFDQTIYWTGN